MAAVRGFLYARHGLEASSPYYDRRLVEFMLSIPQEQIARPGERRRLQRRAMRHLLPESVWRRDAKTYFYPMLRQGVEEKEWHRISLLLQDPRIVQDGWVDGDWLARLMRGREVRAQHAHALSLCVNLELWLSAVEDARRSGGWSSPWRWGGR